MQTNPLDQTNQALAEITVKTTDQIIHVLLEQIQSRDQKIANLAQEVQYSQYLANNLKATLVDYAALQADRDLIYTQLVTTSTERNALKVERNILKSKTDALHKEIANLKAHQRNLNYALQNLLQSKSWQITSGFRAIGLLIRGVLSLNTQLSHFAKTIVLKITGKYSDSFKRLSQIRLLESNPAYVDKNYYYSQNPDIAALNLNVVEHYYDYGSFEGRNPNQDFNTRFYLDTYPDVIKSGVNPLWHYLEYGQKEYRLTKPPVANDARLLPNFASLNQTIAIHAEKTDDINTIYANLDLPAEDDVVYSTLVIEGWAGVQKGYVESVEIYINDEPAQRLNYGKFRPDVINLFPELTSSQCGFYGNFSLQQFVENEVIQLRIMIRTDSGDKSELSRRVTVSQEAYNFTNTQISSMEKDVVWLMNQVQLRINNYDPQKLYE